MCCRIRRIRAGYLVLAGRRQSGPGPDLAERSRHPRCEGECVADDPVRADALLRGPHGSRAGTPSIGRGMSAGEDVSLADNQLLALLLMAAGGRLQSRRSGGPLHS